MSSLLPPQRRALTLTSAAVIALHGLLLLGLPRLDSMVRAGTAQGSFVTRVIAPAAPPASPEPASESPALPETPSEPQAEPVAVQPAEQPAPAPNPRPAPAKRRPAAPPVISESPSTDDAPPQPTARGAAGGSDSPLASLFDAAPKGAFGGSRPDVPTQPSLEGEAAEQAIAFAGMGESHAAIVPRGATLGYRVSGTLGGQPVDETATLAWRRAATYYEADWHWPSAARGHVRLESVGLISEQGQLLPVLSGPRTGGAVPARFDYADRSVHFAEPEGTAALQPGTQDALSAIVQLAAWLAGDRRRFEAGQTFTLPVADGGSVRSWRWLVESEATVTAFNGESLPAIKLTHLPVDDASGTRPRMEVWFVRSLDYLPARLRLSWSNGDTLDQVARTARLNRAPAE